MMEMIKARVTASEGYAIGPVYLVEKKEICVDQRRIDATEVDTELEKFRNAVKEAVVQLQSLAQESEIFSAHVEIVNDFTLHEAAELEIRGGKNAEAATEAAVMQFVHMFESMEGEYMQERAADMRDVLKRLLMIMQGIDDNPFAAMTEPSVIVADDLVPSDTAIMDFEKVLGFITAKGGVTSHVSIIAKNRGIPCLTGISEIMEKAAPHDRIILAAQEGEILIRPDDAVVESYRKKEQEYLKEKRLLMEASTLPSITLDGRKFEMCANVGNLEEIENALTYPIEGVGLFRSEFLYMMKKDDFPSEEEQYAVYRRAAELMGGKELTIRTLDIGGDKGLDYFTFPKEDNPFLGYRAIRICLDREEILHTQLCALLRASAYGNIRIMYPMIISLEELTAANAVLETCKEELREKGIPFNEAIEVGMMIETPASVMMAEEFAKHVDFFSIGTNDLTQYLLAVDRGNEKIAAMYDSFHPAVLRAIAYVIKAAHKEGIQVGMCGEFASNPKASMLLLGMGLDEFSMSPGSIASVKYLLRGSSYEEMQGRVETVLSRSNIADVMAELS